MLRYASQGTVLGFPRGTVINRLPLAFVIFLSLFFNTKSRGKPNGKFTTVISQDRFTLRSCKIYVFVVLHFFGVMYKLEKKNYQLPRQSVNGKINDLAITDHYFYGNRGNPGKER